MLLSAVLYPYTGFTQPGAVAATLDPVGTWRCIVYGNPTLGDERVLMSFAPDHTAHMARAGRETSPAWLPLSGWRIVDGTLSFADPRSGREFEAVLDRETLSGEWRTYNLLGGWWCTATGSDSGPTIDILERAASSDEEPARQLIPKLMASPTYPLQAIRDAREGRVLLCFVVDPSGEIQAPEFVELSDEIFRSTSLDALMRSRYRQWDPRHGGGARPACRSFIYRLDYVY